MAIAIVPGCRNQDQGQTDLIQREMRHQEDQIYALQDYLAEYQQLLCEARMENKSLREQMVSGQFKDGEPRVSENAADAARQATIAAGTTGTASRRDAPEPAIEENIDMTLPDAPPLDLDTPAAPPLKQGTSEEPRRRDHKVTAAVAIEADQPPEMPAVIAASYVEASESENTRTDRQTETKPPREKKPQPMAAVAVRAEVSIDAEAPGPRVLVDVLPMAADGSSASLEGDMSLLFRNPDGLGNSKDVARWDFKQQELKQFARATSHGTTYVFPLQLPATAPGERPVELWVRVIPKQGEKILSHASLDLSRSGRYVFDERLRSGTAEFVVKQASAEMPASSSIHDGRPRGIVTNVDGWQIARPGDRPDESPASSQVESGWRIATQPIPVVESHAVLPDPIDGYPAGDRYGTAPAAEAEAAPRELPQWIPERSEQSTPAADHTSSPSWSAKR